MECISIRIPAALYVSIYELYGEETSDVILDSLNKLINEEAENSKVSEAPKSVVADFEYLRPRAGTITAKVWEIADRILKEEGAITMNHRDLVIQACTREDIKANTASTQYSSWRKVHR